MSSRESRNQRVSPSHGASRYSDSGFSSSSGRPTNPVNYTEFDSRLQFNNLDQLQNAYRQLWDEKEKLKASCQRYEDELANKRAPTPEIDTLRKYRNTIKLLNEDKNELIKDKKALAKDLETLRKDNAGLIETLKQRDTELESAEDHLAAAESRSLRYKEERNAALTAIDGKIRSDSSGSSSDRKREKERAKEEKARLGQRFSREDNKTAEHTLPMRPRRMGRFENEPPYIEDDILARADNSARPENYSTTATTGFSRAAPVDTSYQAPRSYGAEATSQFAADGRNDRQPDNGLYNPLPIPRPKGRK